MTSLKHDAPGGINLDSARGKNGCAQLEACRLPALQAIGLSKFGDLHRPERHNPSLNHYLSIIGSVMDRMDSPGLVITRHLIKLSTKISVRSSYGKEN